jgi:hypothetical protein
MAALRSVMDRQKFLSAQFRTTTTFTGIDEEARPVSPPHQD